MLYKKNDSWIINDNQNNLFKNKILILIEEVQIMPQFRKIIGNIKFVINKIFILISFEIVEVICEIKNESRQIFWKKKKK